MAVKIREMFRGSLPQMLAALVCTFSIIADGMQYGWSAPILPLLRKQNPPIIREDDAVWIESLYMIGGLVGLPVTIYLVDKFGRKNSVVASSYINLLGWVLIGVAYRREYVLVGRFLTGMAADVAFNAAPIYIAEIALQKIRGFLSGIVYVMVVMGIIIVYAVGPFIPIYASSLIGALILVLQVLAFPFLPESPYYLLYINREVDSAKALKALRGDGNIEQELQEIAAAVERQKGERGRFLDLFLIPSNRKALIIVWFLTAAQHFGGISVMLMNFHEILEAAGSIYIQPEATGIIFSCLMFIAVALSILVVDQYGRKILLLISGVLSGITLLVLALYFHLKELQYDLQGVSWIPVVSVMVYAVVFKFGLGIIPVIILAEFFPAKVKVMGMATTDGIYVTSSAISIYIFQFFKSSFGIYAPFYIYTCCVFITILFIIFKVPETKGKSLEEIQMLLKKL